MMERMFGGGQNLTNQKKGKALKDLSPRLPKGGQRCEGEVTHRG